MQDHLEVYVQIASKQPITLYKHWNLVSKAMIGAQWLLTKTGLGASNQLKALLSSAQGLGFATPTFSITFFPLLCAMTDRRLPGHGFQAHVDFMRSASRGSVTLASADPNAAPVIRFNYMSEAQDWDDFRRCIRLTREIFSQPAFEPFAAYEIQPGDHLQSDDEIDGFHSGARRKRLSPLRHCEDGTER